MESRNVRGGLYTANRLLVAMTFVVLSGFGVGLGADAQSESARVEDLFGTPPLTNPPPNTTITLKRITYQPGQTLDLQLPGPVILYVESGELTVPEGPTNPPTVLLISGPDLSPPATQTEDGFQTLPPGYAIYAEGGNIGTTQNRALTPATILAVVLTPQPLDGYATAVAEATASP